MAVSAGHLQAAAGEELLVQQLPASAMNKAVVKTDVLLSAVTKAVIKNPKQGAEITCAAMAKSRGNEVHNSIVKTAIAALGPKPSKNAVGEIVYAAVKCSDCVDRNDQTADAGCACAGQLTKSAIEALGPNPSEALVLSITESAIRGLDGRCADAIVRAATEAAPEYAASIADAGARAGRGTGQGNGALASGEALGEDGVVFNPTGRPVPAPFVFPPAGGGGGGIVRDTTPVN
jgi:hypothetical protein